MVDTKLIKEEVKLANNECCIIFDLGCYFPYANPEILTFDFSLGEEELDDYKLNHRYPNKRFQTISKKYGKKVSKIGYPYIMKLNKQTPMLLCINIGINKEYFTHIFPIQTYMTKEHPISILSFHYFFDKNEFYFISKEYINDGCHYIHHWFSHENERKREGDIILKSPQKAIANKNVLIYEDIIIPYNTN